MRRFIVLIYLAVIISCRNFDPKNDSKKDIVNYYHGVVLNERHENLSGVSVEILDSGKQTTLTDDNGYFQIKNNRFNKINIQKEKNIVFYKDGYITDTISTLLLAPNYSGNKRINNYFIYDTPDTILLRSKKF